MKKKTHVKVKIEKIEVGFILKLEKYLVYRYIFDYDKKKKSR